MKTFSGKQRHYSYRVLTFQDSAKQQRFIGRHIDRKENTRKEMETVVQPRVGCGSNAGSGCNSALHLLVMWFPRSSSSGCMWALSGVEEFLRAVISILGGCFALFTTFELALRFPLPSMESHCDLCDNPAAKRCSSCRKSWCCSEECQKRAWPLHIFDCTPGRPIKTAYYLYQAVALDMIPGHPRSLRLQSSAGGGGGKIGWVIYWPHKVFGYNLKPR